jgi:hypothetical protein
MKIRRIVPTVLIFLFPISMSLLVYFHGITVPYKDHWTLAPLLYKLHLGELGFHDLWAQHNSHRLLFPRIIMLTLVYLSKWNIYLELYTSFTLAIFALLILTRLLKLSCGASFNRWHAVLLSSMVFTPTQYENFLMGWQIQIFLSNLSVLAAIYAVVRFTGTKGLLSSSAAATVASYSFSTGMLSWLVIGFILLLHPRWHIKYFLVMGTIFVLVATSYFAGYKPGHHQVFFWEEPFNFLLYVFAFLGSPLFIGEYFISCIIGFSFSIVFVCLSVHAWRLGRDEFIKLLPWIATGLYVIMSAIAIATGRLGLGVEQAMADRYTTISVLFIISTLVLLIHFIRNHPIKNVQSKARLFPLVTFAILFITLYVLTYRDAIINIQRWSVPIKTASACLENTDAADSACLGKLHPDVSRIKGWVKMLEDIGFR